MIRKNRLVWMALLILGFVTISDVNLQSAEGGDQVANQATANSDSDPKPTAHTADRVDMLWVLLAASMVFMMQAGFKYFEVGMMREKHGSSIGMKNAIDYVVVALMFFLVGFGLMFGKSAGGIIGTDMFALGAMETSTEAGDGLSMGYIFFLFQLAFAGTAVTIVSGAMAERTAFVTYMTASVFVGLIIYPVFGHWCWGSLFYEGNQGWLEKLGFSDFAGSTVVHSVGAWTALVGVLVLGPRLGRYSETGELNEFKCYNIPYAILGVIILWFGWWGFNGGSQLALDAEVGGIIMKTTIAAAAGGLVAFFHCLKFQGRANINEKFLGGILGGLVGITACCNIVSGFGAVAVGAIAGIVHNYSFDLVIKKWRIDDAVGAIPVHGFCGVWGTLAVAIFDAENGFSLNQLGIQALGCVVCFIWSAGTAFVVFKLCKATVGLRVSPEEEFAGINIGGKHKPAATEAMSEADLKDLM